MRVGEFYDGTLYTFGPRLTLTISEKLRLRPSYRHSRFSLPGGSFTSEIVNVRTNYSFSDRWLADSLVQYNSVFERVSVFARLRYIYRVGDDLYIVYRQVGPQDGLLSGLQDRSLTAKFTYSFSW